MSALFNLVPWYYRLVALALLSLALVGFGYVKGYKAGHSAYDTLVAKQATEAVKIIKGQDTVTTQVVTKYVPQVARAQVITETITKEVPVYVPSGSCPLPGGFRVLHDAAAQGVVPDAAAGADAAPVSAQDATGTVTENYGTCREDQLRLKGLQEWISEQLKVNPP